MRQNVDEKRVVRRYCPIRTEGWLVVGPNRKFGTQIESNRHILFLDRFPWESTGHGFRPASCAQGERTCTNSLLLLARGGNRLIHARNGKKPTFCRCHRKIDFLIFLLCTTLESGPETQMVTQRLLAAVAL